MAVISSTSMKETTRMTDRIAEKDITEVNELGQTVVVVAKGQPIPEGVEVPKAAKPAEDKARRGSRGK